MTITPRVEKAINTLVDAFNADTLIPGHCVACAVGNLVAKGMDATIVKTPEFIPGFKAMKEDKKVNSHAWFPAFQNEYIAGLFNLEGMVAPTGFSVDELRQIEKAFESNTEHKYESSFFIPKECLRKDQLKGLKAVVKTMLKLDNCEGADIDEIFTDKIQPIQNQPL